MRTVVRRALEVVALILITASTAVADPVSITSGVLQWIRGPSAVRTTFSGSDFSFEGLGGAPDTIFRAYSICMEPVCVPGRDLNISARWGTDLGGGGDHDGRPFAISIATLGGLEARWKGNLLIPLGFTGGSLSAPFAFTADLWLPEAAGQTSLHPLSGAGTATLSFSKWNDSEFPGSLVVDSLQYDFAATPEPTSLLLLGSGLAGVWVRARGRKARATSRRSTE